MAFTDLSPAELLAFRPEVDEPADFDAFWTQTLLEARAPAETTLTRARRPEDSAAASRT